MFEVVICFEGPLTTWSQKVEEDEVIARIRAPWLWLARWLARSTLSGLNQGRCGYAIRKGSEVVERFTQS